MNKQEAAATPGINLWFSNIFPKSAPWEIKHTRGSSTFNFSEIKPHQWDYLLAATTKKGFVYKIVDFGPTSPPCDVVHYKNCEAFIIVQFPTHTYAIEIRILNLLREQGKTTINEAEADRYSIHKIANVKLPR